MKHRNKIEIFSVLFFGLLLTMILPANGFCQGTSDKKLVISADMLWDYAHVLMGKKDYATARVELKRFVHFFPEDERIAPAKLDTATCLFHGQEYLDAARICNDIMLTIPQSRTGEEACFLQSLCFEKMDNFGYAKLVLHNYLKLMQNEQEGMGKGRYRQVMDRIYFHLGRLYLEQGANTASFKEMERAEDFFDKMSLAGKKDFHVEKYLDALSRAKAFPVKNPRLAGVLSLVPGAGFLYTHRLHDALAALVVNGGLIAAACTAWEHDNRVLAGLLGFLETGFYTGNIYGSISAAHKYNRKGLLDLVNGQVSLSPVLGKGEYGVVMAVPFPLIENK